MKMPNQTERKTYTRRQIIQAAAIAAVGGTAAGFVLEHRNNPSPEQQRRSEYQTFLNYVTTHTTAGDFLKQAFNPTDLQLRAHFLTATVLDEAGNNIGTEYNLFLRPTSYGTDSTRFRNTDVIPALKVTVLPLGDFNDKMIVYETMVNNAGGIDPRSKYGGDAVLSKTTALQAIRAFSLEPGLYGTEGWEENSHGMDNGKPSDFSWRKTVHAADLSTKAKGLIRDNGELILTVFERTIHI